MSCVLINHLHIKYCQDDVEDPFVDIIPEPGLVLVFQHVISHEGMRVNGGVKYAIRSDVMYSRTDDDLYTYESENRTCPAENIDMKVKGWCVLS